MKGNSFFIALITIASDAWKVHTANRIFTCGVINGHSTEYDAINIALNNTSTLNNVSIVAKKFNLSESIDLFHQASVFLQQNVIVLIEGSHTTTSACTLSTVTGIPLIHLHGDSRPNDHCEKAVQMSAGYKDYAHASLEIINMFRWEKIALVFDDERLNEAWYFYAMSQKSQLTVNLVPLSEYGNSEDPTAPVMEAMDKISFLKPDIILLYTEKENFEIMLQQKPCHKCNEGYKWILQGQVPLNLNCQPDNVVVAMKLPYIDSQAPKKLENVVLMNYNETKKDFIALAYDSVQVINQALNRDPCSLINGTSITSKDREAVLTCIRKVNMDGSTGSVHFNEHGNRKGISLEILNLRNDSFKKIGTWNSTKGTVMFGNIIRNMRTSSSSGTLEGRKLRAVILENHPFIMKKQDGDTQISYEGYSIDLFNELASILKFTYEIYPSPDGFFGAERDNGTWNGLIGELVNKRADVAVASLTVTEAREKVVDFTVPFMFYTEDIIMKKAHSEEKVDLLQFMAPFHSYVWCCTLGIVIIISVAVFVINYFSPYGYKDENGQGTSEEFSCFNSLWFAVACMLQQGGDNTPRSLSGRILAGCYWFCILIWISTYTANLAAFFTVKVADYPVNNLEDIAKSTYGVGVIDSSSVYQTFKESQYEIHHKIWKRMQTGKTFAKSISQGIQWVREREDFVFINDGPSLRYAANQPPCDLTTVPGLSTASGFALALQANDPHSKELTLAILHLLENNFLEKLRRKWWETANQCPKEEYSALSRNQIGLTSMLGVYVVLGVGMVVAFMALIAEIYWKKRVKQKLVNKFRRCRTKITAVKVIQGDNN